MQRVDYRKLGGESWRALGALAKTADGGSLSLVLRELVKLRASQINGCANCVNLHANRLREAGESEQRIQMVVVWWEAPCFDAREKAALAWTEAVTQVADSRVPDALYAEMAGQFSEQELVELTFVICTINVHNRLAVAFRRVPGS